MKKSTTPTSRLFTYATLLCILSGVACSSPRMSRVQAVAPSSLSSAENFIDPMPDAPAETQVGTDQFDEENQFTASNSGEAAAAASRSSAYPTLTAAKAASVAPDRKAGQTVGKATGQTAGKKIQAGKLPLPAKFMLKQLAKKAQKLEKKLDIKQATQAKEINNTRFLVLGIVLAAVGLVLVIVGNTTLLYVLGSVASLAGLIFLLLALL